MWQGQVRPPRKTACHKQIREVARAAAGELYETLMGNNDLWTMWQKQNPGLTKKQLERRFIDKNWGRCIEFARGTLAHLLTRPDVDEKTKEQIMEVLILDNSIPVGRIPPGRAIQIANLAEVAQREGWRP